MSAGASTPSGDVGPGDVQAVLAVTPLQVEAAYDIRQAVFVDEQGVPPELELDALDDSADHFLALRDGRPVGAARLVVEPPGYAGVDAARGDVAHLGRLAVLPSARGSGLGGALVRAIEDRARDRGLALCVLSAQTQALAFYARLGYEAYGEEFDDAGIPHRMMRKNL